MGGGPEHSEEYFSPHRRAVIIEEPGSGYLYSIDAYLLLPRLPEGARCMDSPRVGVRLCYAEIRGGCEAVIVDAGDRVELVNYRLRLDERTDPARLAEECDREAERLAQVLRAAQRG